MIEVFMPKAGMDMKEGTLIRWLKEVGETVELDEPIMEIETDKITMEAESPGSGILLSKIVEEGSVVPVLSVLGYIGEAGELPPQQTSQVMNFANSKTEEGEDSARSFRDAVSARGEAEEGFRDAVSARDKVVEGFVNILSSGNKTAENAGTAGEYKGSIPATPYAKKLAREKGIDLCDIAGENSMNGAIHGKDVMATSLAKRVAEVNQVDLWEVAGSGKHGKITRADVERQMQEFSESSQNPFRTVESRQKLKGVRKVVGKRMFESYSQVPTVMQSMKADMTKLLDFRRKLNEGREQKISLNDLLIKATATAVKELPHVRTMVEGDELVTYAEANIGFAVAVEDGLYVPVIRNADQLSVGEISRQARELAKKAREGTIRPDEFSGGTFSISNMGMFDVYTFNPIINQPESGILGITGIEDVLKLVDGQVVVRKEAVLCMSYDHRVMDGVGAAKLKKRVKELIEHPIEILI